MNTMITVRRPVDDRSAGGDEDSGEPGYSPIAILHQVPPDYPSDQQMRHQQDTVKFNVLIAADGSLKEIYPLSGRCVFVESATKAVRKWSFQPAKANGVAIDSYTSVSLSFTGSN